MTNTSEKTDLKAVRYSLKQFFRCAYNTGLTVGQFVAPVSLPDVTKFDRLNFHDCTIMTYYHMHNTTLYYKNEAVYTHSLHHTQ